VFTSVTGLLTFSVSVPAPLAYDPPTTEIFAVVAVRESSWKTGLAAGKLEPLTTDSDEPFTEITALVGGGAGGAGGIFGAERPPDAVPPEVPPDGDDCDEDGVPGPLVWKGSLLSKSENDWSWPVPAGAWTAETSGDVEADGVVAVGAIEPRLGAAGGAEPVGAGVGVDAAVVVAFGSAA
jgi:hypothetical protein